MFCKKFKILSQFSSTNHQERSSCELEKLTNRDNSEERFSCPASVGVGEHLKVNKVDKSSSFTHKEVFSELSSEDIVYEPLSTSSRQ